MKKTLKVEENEVNVFNQDIPRMVTVLDHKKGNPVCFYHANACVFENKYSDTIRLSFYVGDQRTGSIRVKGFYWTDDDDFEAYFEKLEEME